MNIPCRHPKIPILEYKMHIYKNYDFLKFLLSNMQFTMVSFLLNGLNVPTYTVWYFPFKTKEKDDSYPKIQTRRRYEFSP